MMLVINKHKLHAEVQEVVAIQIESKGVGRVDHSLIEMKRNNGCLPTKLHACW